MSSRASAADSRGPRRSHAEIAEQEAAHRHELARLDDLVASTESALSEVQSWDGADRLSRAERLLERERGLANVVSERRRAVAASLLAVTEADVVASLEAESARLAADLAAAEAEAGSLAPERETLERLEDELRRRPGRVRGRGSPMRARRRRDRTDTPTSGLQVAPSARSARQDHDGALARLSPPGSRSRSWPSALPASSACVSSTPRALDELSTAVAALERDHERLSCRPGALSGARTGGGGEPGRERVAGPRGLGPLARPFGPRRGLQAALDETRARAGVERLAGLRGVLGTLADLVDVDEGCERGVRGGGGGRARHGRGRRGGHRHGGPASPSRGRPPRRGAAHRAWAPGRSQRSMPPERAFCVSGSAARCPAWPASSTASSPGCCCVGEGSPRRSRLAEQWPDENDRHDRRRPLLSAGMADRGRARRGDARRARSRSARGAGGRRARIHRCLRGEPGPRRP